MRRWLIVAAAVIAGLLTSIALVMPAEAATETLFGTNPPNAPQDADAAAVTVGVKITAKAAGQVTGVRFYKTTLNTGTHTGAVYSSSGSKLASANFASETATGWQSVTFSKPVKVTAGQTFTAAVFMPKAHYAAVNNYAWPVQTPSLTGTAGVYKYGTNIGFPTTSFQGSNYFVDLTFAPTVSPSPSPTPTATTSSPTPTPTPTTASPTPTDTATATASPTPTATPTGALGLPLVPWEGGKDYYKQFPKSAGFTDPNEFPIAVWWATFDSDANVKWDKDHGINTYVQFNPNTPGQYVGANGMHYINDGPMAGMTATDPAWVGWWLDDEVDGRYNATEGPGVIQAKIDAQGSSDRFDYANYTGFVTGDHSTDGYQSVAERYVNMVPGQVSVDGYYYTDPSCDDPNRYDNQMNRPDAAHCRTAAAYGGFIRSLRTRDQVDGKLQPLWGFVENGAPMNNSKYIQPEQMKGAAWSIVVNGARGVIWFNQSFSGSCGSGNVIRDAEASPNGCNKDRVQAMKDVNTEIQSFAPILNTQSYDWKFGTGMDTMLKVKDGSAYIFAMVGLNADPGQRDFTLPNGISGTSVEVVGENRTIPISGGKFTDSFAAEYTHHVYKITI